MSTKQPATATEETSPRVEVSASRSVLFEFCQTAIIGKLPPTMVCLTLRRERDAAMGWTKEAREAQIGENERAKAAGEKAKVVLDPDNIDQHALAAIYTACVGLCWPDEEGLPSWRAHRHDPVSYGEEVLDWLLQQHPGQAEMVFRDTREVGRALYNALNDAYTGLFVQAEQEAGFTGKREATG